MKKAPPPTNAKRPLQPHGSGFLLGQRTAPGLYTCPFCLTRNVIVIRTQRSETVELAIERRRQCMNLECSMRFTTIEMLKFHMKDITVIKRDGRMEPFDVVKLRRSLQLATAKRNIAAPRIERIVNSIRSQFEPEHPQSRATQSTRRTVTSERLGTLCLASLKELDTVSYIRYASIFLRFLNTDDYHALLTTLSSV